MTLDDFPPRQTKQAHYPIAFRLEAVRRVEAGEVQRVVAAAMGIAPLTLIEWLRRHGTAAYALLQRKVYTPAQKHAIVRALRPPLTRPLRLATTPDWPRSCGRRSGKS